MKINCLLKVNFELLDDWGGGESDRHAQKLYQYSACFAIMIVNIHYLSMSNCRDHI